MGSILDILLFLTFLIEFAVLFYLEKKTWHTLYTPLIFLMVPYVVVLLITICVAGHKPFVSFYYPSIIFWMIGLLIFSIPSYSLGLLMNNNHKPLNSDISSEKIPNIIWYVALFLCAIFLLRFFSMSSSSTDLIGSEDFGLKYCGRGVWGHLRQFCLPLIVISIYYVDRKHLWLWIIIIIMSFVSFMYQVKGWVIIPCIAGISLRLYFGKSKLKLSLIIYLLIGALSVFFIAYWLMPILAGGTAGIEIVGFIFGHFFHYLSSGVLGFSVDMQNNFPDTGNFDIIWAPFINLFNQFSGNEELISPINSYYYYTGLNLTNVRTFFGTLFLYANWIEFIGYILLLSIIMYLLKICSIIFNNIFVYSIYFFECGLLFFGWFEFYFFHLTVIEFPVMTIILLFFTKIITNNKVKRMSLLMNK